MRISDWSSDVCSSDLLQCRHGSTFPAVHVFCPKVGCAARSCWPAPSLRRSRSRRILARHISETMSHSPGKGNILQVLRAQKRQTAVFRRAASGDRKSVVQGKSVSVGVDPGGRRLLKKTKETKE